MNKKNRDINIAFIDHFPFFGGSQISLLMLLENFNFSEINTFLFTTEDIKKVCPQSNLSKLKTKINFVYLPRLKAFKFRIFLDFFRSMIDLRKQVSDNNIDVIFCNTVRAAIIGIPASCFSKVKVIVYFQDCTFPKFFLKLFLFKIDIAYCVSEAVVGYYKLEDNRKCKVINIWRDPNDFIEISKLNQSIKEKICTIGYIGRLVEMKGLQILVTAFLKIVKEEKEDINLLIAGTGEGQFGNNEEALKKMVKNYGLENRIRFVGFVDDVPEFLRKIDLLCLPSLIFDAYPGVAVEAMMSKIPVIASNVGGISEIVKDVERGWLVEPGSVKELREKIIFVIKNKTAREAVVKNAYNYVLQNNNIKNSVSRIKVDLLNIMYG